jgi:hypothetical protein
VILLLIVSLVACVSWAEVLLLVHDVMPLQWHIKHTWFSPAMSNLVLSPLPQQQWAEI